MTAIARTLPALARLAAVFVMSNIIVILPLITSVIAGLLPLYGTWIIFVPVMRASSSPDRWFEPPTPAEP